MKSKGFIKFIDERTKEIYGNPDSILKRYDEFLALNDVYHSHNPMIFHKDIKGRFELCDGIIEFYKEVKLSNEKISLLDDLFAIGYDKDELIQMIFDIFEHEKDFQYLWECGDLLYSMKRYKYLPQYLKIIENKEYGTARQMVVLLVGKSKKAEVIPILKELLKDADVEGHVLQALGNYGGDDIEEIMHQYSNHKTTWIRNTAKKYLKKHSIPLTPL